MTRKTAIFAAFCGFWATFPAPLPAAPTLDRLTSVAVEDGQLVLALEKAGAAMLAHVYISDPTRAADALRPFIGRTLAVKREGPDRYGRLQTILTPKGEPSLQERLIARGQALVYSPGAFPQSGKWLALESRGSVVAAADAANYHQRFAQVSGTVTRVYPGRAAYDINFGEDWKSDFSIRIPRKAWRAFGKDFAFTPGDRVTARGIVIEDGGPMIVVTRPEHLEVQRAHAR